MEHPLAGCYQEVWGFAVRQKSGRSGAKWVKEATGVYKEQSVGQPVHF